MLQLLYPPPPNSAIHFRGQLDVRWRHGGVEKGGGWKTSRMTPLPKRGFGTPLVRYVFHPPQVSVLCFSCAKVHDRADQKLFWRGPKIFRRARSLVRFPPPIRFAPPHITAQLTCDTLSGPILRDTAILSPWYLDLAPRMALRDSETTI